MKVNMNSWHYKTANMFDWRISSSLCVYFWQVVWAVFYWWMILPAAIILFAGTLLGIFPFVVGKMVLDLFDYTSNTGKWANALLCAGLGYLFLIAIFSVFAGINCLRGM